MLCDSLPAASEFADAATDPAIDVILEAQPVLDFMVMRVRKDWRLLLLDVENMVTHDDQGTCRAEPAR